MNLVIFKIISTQVSKYLYLLVTNKEIVKVQTYKCSVEFMLDQHWSFQILPKYKDMKIADLS